MSLHIPVPWALQSSSFFIRRWNGCHLYRSICTKVASLQVFVSLQQYLSLHCPGSQKVVQAESGSTAGRITLFTEGHIANKARWAELHAFHWNRQEILKLAHQLSDLQEGCRNELMLFNYFCCHDVALLHPLPAWHPLDDFSYLQAPIHKTLQNLTGLQRADTGRCANPGRFWEAHQQSPLCRFK